MSGQINNLLVLSLFPGLGLLDRAFEMEGFCVVRSPDKLLGGDIKNFSAPVGKFDGIIGGSPCKAFSALRHIIKHNGYELAENLIPEFERVVFEAQPEWFLHENVREAPIPVVVGYQTHDFLLNNRWLGEEQNRVRRFVFGTKKETVDLRQWIQLAALESPVFEYAVTAKNTKPVPVKLLKSGKARKARTSLPNGGTTRTLQEALRLQGLPGDFFQHTAFTMTAQREMVGNGVPVPMGKVLAIAIKKYLETGAN